ncbi:MAG: hypothetical protein WC455_19300 [Dehalococcoidia bacterium]|jgi:hypothetical protein
MQSRIFNLNWEKFDYKNPAEMKNLMGALQMFVALPNRFAPPQFSKIAEFMKAHRQIQEFTTYSDGYPNEKAIPIIEKFHMLKDYDTQFEQIFDVRDFAGTKASGFDVAGVNSGLTFKDIKVGEKLKVYQMSGDKYRCYFCYYGGALGWHKQLFEDGDWWQIEDNAIEFRNKAYSSRASVYYGLLEAAADAVGSCQVIPSGCSDCDADARSIMASINYAVQSILINVKDRGYSLDPTTTEFLVVTPLQLMGRVKQALAIRMQNFNESPRLANFNIRQITTMGLSNPNRVLVVLPKRTLKIGYRMDLTMFESFDMLSYTQAVAGWMRHGGCIGDLDQVQSIEFTAESGSCPNKNATPIAGCGDVTDAEGAAMTEGIELGADFVAASNQNR